MAENDQNSQMRPRHADLFVLGAKLKSRFFQGLSKLLTYHRELLLPR
jgi:hypothetical protein